MRNEAVIVAAVRSPMGRGKPGGSLAALHAVDVLGPVLEALVARHRLDPGAPLMTTMPGALERSGGRYGLQTMCEAGGMANATVIERL